MGMQLEATEPDFDDIINIESPLNKTSNVAFKLTNQFKTFAEFDAYFTTESANEFSIQPTSGILEPSDRRGTTFVISYFPTEYGKPKIGRLIIKTDEMQWTYEIRGSFPEYKPPLVK